MGKDQFTEQLNAYSRWKEDAIRQIKAYRDWLAAHEMSSHYWFCRRIFPW
jgi:hypothetical protein